MARQRLIKPTFFTDEQLAAIPPHGRLLFAGLWCLADKRGRLRDQPPVIRGQLFPFEPELDVDGLLTALEDAGSILRYEVDGRAYIQVKNFEREQKPHPREAESQLPAPPQLYRGPRQRKPQAATAQSERDQPFTEKPCNLQTEPRNFSGIRSFVPSFLHSLAPSESDPAIPRLAPPEDVPANGDAPAQATEVTLDVTAGHPDAPGLWEAAMLRLSGVVPPHEFATWLRPVESVRWDGDTFVIEAPSPQHETWLKGAYKPRLRTVFNELGLQAPGVRIRIDPCAREPTVLHNGAL